MDGRLVLVNGTGGIPIPPVGLSHGADFDVTAQIGE